MMQSRTRIKICGFTNRDDAEAAVLLGVDALGFNFFEESPRYLPPSAAREIIEGLPVFTTAVGLFVNPQPEQVQAAIEAGVDLLQFHGDEDDAFCRGFDRHYFKVLRVNSVADVVDSADRYPSARALMVDKRVDGEWGGTGKQLAWQRAPELTKPLVLAGGLTPDNVYEAVRLVRPWAVDASSGVERVKGRKDHDLIREFVSAVKAADEDLSDE